MEQNVTHERPRDDESRTLKGTPSDKGTREDRIAELQAEIDRVETVITQMCLVMTFGDLDQPSDEDLAEAYGRLSELSNELMDLQLQQIRQKHPVEDRSEWRCEQAIKRDEQLYQESA